MMNEIRNSVKKILKYIDSFLYIKSKETEMTKFLKERGGDMAREIADNIKKEREDDIKRAIKEAKKEWIKEHEEKNMDFKNADK